MSAHACLTLAKLHQHEQNERQPIVYAKVALMLRPRARHHRRREQQPRLRPHHPRL